MIDEICLYSNLSLSEALKSVRLQDDGSGPYIAEWNVEGKTKPTIDELASFTGQAKLQKLRQERNRLLAETDWWALKDRTMTTAETTYRQALRDITETYSSLEDVVWPVKPE